MTMTFFSHRTDTAGRLPRVRDAVAHLPMRKSKPQPTFNAGRWATLPGEYASAWTCPLDERLPAIVTPGVSAPIACGKAGTVILHLAGAWSGQVAFEGSADGSTWCRVALISLTEGAAEDETDHSGLWRTLPGQQITYLRLDVAHLSHGAILASVAVAPAVAQPVLRSLDPAA